MGTVDLFPGIPAPIAMIGTAEKGYASLQLKVVGVDGHGSSPQYAKDPIRMAAYNFIGVANPEVYAKARAKGMVFRYANHRPTCVVDLDAIPFGAKVASVMKMELLTK